MKTQLMSYLFITVRRSTLLSITEAQVRLFLTSSLSRQTLFG